MASEDGARPKAGWYADPERGGTQRYWDGSAWTDRRKGKYAAAAPGSLPMKTTPVVPAMRPLADSLDSSEGRANIAAFRNSPSLAARTSEPVAQDAVRATERLRLLFVFGVLVAVVGVVIMVASYPEVGTTSFLDEGPAAETSGSYGGVLAGLGVVGVGNLMALVSIIGWGVKLGMQAVSRPAQQG